MSRVRSGHIRHYRKEMDSYVWSLKPEYYKVWQTILLSVNWKEGQADFAGEVRTIKPGQMVTGRKDLAKKAGQQISPSQVKRALEKFEKAGMVKTESSNKGTLLTVVNWSNYQVLPDEPDNKRTTTDQQTDSNRTTNGQQATTNEEVKKGKKGKKIWEVFDFWNESDAGVQHRSMKDAFRKSIKARLKDFTVDELKESISNLAEAYNSDDYYWSHKWTLKEFLSRQEGAKVEQFLEGIDQFKKDNSGPANCSLPSPESLSDKNEGYWEKVLPDCYSNSKYPSMEYSNDVEKINRHFFDSESQEKAVKVLEDYFSDHTDKKELKQFLKNRFPDYFNEDEAA